METLINKMRGDMRQDHIDRLKKPCCSVDAGVFFIALISNFEKMGGYSFIYCHRGEQDKIK